MLRIWRVCALLVLSSTWLSIAPALAHNAAGHKIIAEIAWRKLPAQQRNAIATILRKHPRFTQDFRNKMPSEIRNGNQAEQDHWIFCQAAIWPDIARGYSGALRERFHRPSWHYINLPVFLSNNQATTLQGLITVNLNFDPAATSDEKAYNGVQAVKHNLEVIKDSSSTDAQKAVAYCWLLHVIPDLAQPLHSSALFTVDLFPKGDRGGGEIMIRREGSSGDEERLHGVWDSLLGKTSDFAEIQTEAGNLIEKHEPHFDAHPPALENDVWAGESHDVAEAAAYGPLKELLSEAEQDGSIDVIEAPDSYFLESTEVMGEHAVIAGVRLAGVLASTLPSPGGGANPSALAFSVGGGARASAERAPRAGGEMESIDLRDLAVRMSRIEAELTQIRALLERGSVMERSPREKPRFGRTGARRAATTVDDREQCDCGMDE